MLVRDLQIAILAAGKDMGGAAQLYIFIHDSGSRDHAAGVKLKNITSDCNISVLANEINADVAYPDPYRRFRLEIFAVATRGAYRPQLLAAAGRVEHRCPGYIKTPQTL